jgi:hypothetical protein
MNIDVQLSYLILQRLQILFIVEVQPFTPHVLEVNWIRHVSGIYNAFLRCTYLVMKKKLAQGYFFMVVHIFNKV